MKELHALVDFENVQPSLEALAKLAPGFAASHTRRNIINLVKNTVTLTM